LSNIGIVNTDLVPELKIRDQFLHFEEEHSELNIPIKKDVQEGVHYTFLSEKSWKIIFKLFEELGFELRRPIVHQEDGTTVIKVHLRELNIV